MHFSPVWLGMVNCPDKWSAWARHGDFATSGLHRRCRGCRFLGHRARRSRSTLMLINRCRSAWRVYFGVVSLRAFFCSVPVPAPLYWPAEIPGPPSPRSPITSPWFSAVACQLSCVGPSKVRFYFLNYPRQGGGGSGQGMGAGANCQLERIDWRRAVAVARTVTHMS